VGAPKNRRVVALIYDGVCTFEFAIVVEVFALRRPELDVDWYTFAVASIDRASSRATGGVRIVAPNDLSILRRAGTIVIPGWKGANVPVPRSLIRALRDAHNRGARLMSVCSGVFVLAATGLLDGKRATTHWRYVDALRSRYPSIHVEPDVLYVDEGDILTSAGSAAGIDLCLHVVRRDYGAAIANEVARRMVVPPHRDGGQAQYIAGPVAPRAESNLSAVMEWATRRLQAALSVKQLAARANMSPRTFARRFVEQTGTTPHRWLTRQRLFAAQRMLETTSHAIDRIAETVGFDTPEALRHHFRRQFGTTPTQYRKRFSTS
jgi:AraC family transcriptional regulator, transcriptional activator FtrA